MKTLPDAENQPDDPGHRPGARGPSEVSKLLEGARAGDESAVARLLPLVYAELKGLAGAIFSEQRGGHTLQPTAVVHEAWMKMAAHVENVEDRHHFFAVAAQAMRQVLRDHARGKNRQKRGGGAQQVTLDTGMVVNHPGGIDLLAFEEALERLGALNERHARVVELRFLGSLTIAETADILGVGQTTVESDWSMARAWLRKELGAVG